ncbi:MAG: hypothetical protein ACYTHK_07000 [Planctomycetota bacterium]|jgi:hypothetical protein
MRLLLLLLLIPATADDEQKRAEAVARFGETQAKNRRFFHGYRWAMREEVFLERERRARRSFLMQLDKEGKLVFRLQGSSLIKSRKPKVKIVTTQADKKREKEMIAFVEAAEAALRRYVYYPTDRMTAALGGAKIERGTGSYEHAAVATAANFLDAGDTVRIWIDPESNRPLWMEFTTRVQRESVRGRVAYELYGKTGHYYPWRAEIYSSRRKIQLKLENHTLQAAAKK